MANFEWLSGIDTYNCFGGGRLSREASDYGGEAAVSRSRICEI